MDNDIIRLNVGGEIFATTEITLLKYPSSKLANICNSISSETDLSYEIFLDISPSLFGYVMDWLRYDKLNPGNSKVNWDALKDVALFLNLPEMKDAIQELKLQMVLDKNQEKFEAEKKSKELLEKLDGIKNSIESLRRTLEAGQHGGGQPRHPHPHPDFPRPPNPDPWMW